ncbi:small glutamine-rich tetratricopeptide repeat-containing protein beta [Clonorchis sinensis]|uniref:Small glutamine-rich tetratricopeptide repeat-containing protein beta n=1 Tax=Clonorchis sinensis TaxID=79923 RepID=G7YPD1_CLOSI|nr:small glutamine-rich tetratricopeptide repeat-containing protein beta [Clonorchis sinensis]
MFLRDLSNANVRSDIQCLSGPGNTVPRTRLLCKEVTIMSSINSYLMVEHLEETIEYNFGLGNLAVSQPSCNLRVTWQLGTERVLQLNDLTWPWKTKGRRKILFSAGTNRRSQNNGRNSKKSRYGFLCRRLIQYRISGNLCMKEGQFEEAIACYTKAIELSPYNAVYFCNRAAAHSRLEQQDKAIEDCQSALKIDPKYSKAYGRMGIAYSSLGDYGKAAEAYRKALELDPTNENCQQNLALAEERLKESGIGSAAAGGLDIGAILNNPMMQNIACQLMRDPNTQNAMADLFRSTFGAASGGAGGGVPTAASTNAANSTSDTDAAQNGPSGGPPNVDQFLRL